MSLNFIKWACANIVLLITCFKTIDYMRYADDSFELILYGIVNFMFYSGMAYIAYYLFLELVYEKI